MRERFVEICTRDIDYMKNLHPDIIRQLYYHSKQRFYEKNEMLFDVGDTADSIFIVIQGVIDIVLTDGQYNKETLDVLGKGSIMGINSIMTNENWFCRAVNNTSLSVVVIQIK